MSATNLYAVTLRAMSRARPVTVNNGTATLNTRRAQQVHVVLSPDANLTSIAPETKVVLRSTVPEGFAVVPLASSGERDGAAAGGVAATSTSGATPLTAHRCWASRAFVAARTGDEDQFTGAMTAHARRLFERARRPDYYQMRFTMKDAPAGKVYACGLFRQ